MVLVDTSIWIDFFGKRPGSGARRLDRVVESGQPFAITSVILQEVLQGARSQEQFLQLEKYLVTQRFLHPLDPVQSFVRAAELYARCRRSGVTPRSTIDCLIAQVAIEHEARLLHWDADFDRMAAVVPELAIIS
jgi:predicted nucleic acid-binding protein